MSEFERKSDVPEENGGRAECDWCAQKECCSESGACGACAGSGCTGQDQGTDCSGCQGQCQSAGGPGATAIGCGGYCPHAAGNEFEWDYDHTVLVFSSDMLEESP